MEYQTWRKALLKKVHQVLPEDFESVAMDLLAFQASYNKIYHQFLKLLGVETKEIKTLDQIPCLPIETFKHHPVKTGEWQEELFFESSGPIKSRHHVRSASHYHKLCINTFEQMVAPLDQCEFFGLLPHYLEAGRSSLVSMVTAFMQHSGQKREHFYLYDFEKMVEAINSTVPGKRPVLFGVSYALLDFAESCPKSIPSETLIIETGGMKGRRSEWSKPQLHAYLSEQLGVSNIWSEYGMTELASQAYASSRNYLHPASTLHVLFKELNDPRAGVQSGKAGVMHLIDLGNLDTCAFIASADIGIDHGEQGFEIVGRIQNSDLRGCQLLYV